MQVETRHLRVSKKTTTTTTTTPATKARFWIASGDHFGSQRVTKMGSA
jgi:hypothetical protein